MPEPTGQFDETELAATQRQLRETRDALTQREKWIQSHLLEKRKADDRLQALQAELAVYIQLRKVLLGIVARVLQSPSWRWMAPLRWVHSMLRPHAATAAHLIPCAGVGRGLDGTWSAAGAMPQFLLPCAPVSGWVRLRLSIQSEDRSRAHLYFDTGSLFNEAESIDLGPVSNDTTREFLFVLPRPVHCFRLDPIRKPGRFAIREFSITPLDGLRVDAAAARLHLGWTDQTESLGPALRRSLALVLHGKRHEARRGFRAILDLQRPDRSNEYDLWRSSRKLTEEQRDAHFKWEKSLANPPLLSIITPTWNTPEFCLRECIESVLAQTYRNWELCIADDGSAGGSVRDLLNSFSMQDPRIKVTFRKTNGGISAASNTALEMASGSHLLLLDHDDTLAPHALHSVATRLVANPLLEMLYSDEDKVADDGRHIDPFFKPDWSPDFFLSCMYTSHLGVYRTALVRDAGGFRSELDGSQDYDLALRLITRIPPARIEHIPDILYHWRMVATSTASGPAAKPHTWDASRRAIQSHLESVGIKATVEPGPSHGLHHVRYSLINRPLVSIVIPSACRPLKSKDDKSPPSYWVRQCVESVRAQSTYDHLEFIVAGPPVIPAELRDWLGSTGVAVSSYDLPFNFSQACNNAASAARGKHLLFLNDDTLVRSADFIEQMLGLSQLPGVGAVGARLFYPDGRLQHAGVVILDGNPCHAFESYPGDHAGYFGSSSLIRNWIAVTGACLMTRREAFNAVSGFDTAFPMNYNDVDLCLRLRDAGYRTVLNPRAELTHHASASSEGHFPHETRLFKERWESRLLNDPFYNRNLTTRSSDFRIES